MRMAGGGDGDSSHTTPPPGVRENLKWLAFAWGLASAASLPVGAMIAIHKRQDVCTNQKLDMHVRMAAGTLHVRILLHQSPCGSRPRLWPLRHADKVPNRPDEKLAANMMAFGGGALLFALSIELFGTTIAQKGHFSTEEYNKIILVMAAAALGGGILFTGLDHLLNNAGAFLRKFSTLHSAQTRGHMGKLLGSRTISALQRTHIFRCDPQ